MTLRGPTMPGDPQPVTPGAPEAPFATRAALLSWLARHAIAHLARLNLEAVAPRLDPADRKSVV